ncbi:hypothetical protein PHIM7_89 [Sinorhizobium phage phiM7]|uniref:Uncharacterized protein n=3 Tax=Emdodecavirus TaxID=1980937 RepID=S5MPK4_9CAUD|nr:virion structural protein [Sinorhizobium phage phiM12]YP_009212344.1 virion structural protein [Sinorhizobium phage phiN3]YP_009601214.1 virion structural protein [Sinorhizobium phage phiM7]AKF12996.1 hypothetical protein PHIM19_90 [Sinorhizobium phage phiM19]AGR47760.1 hypothetical protein SmphiM12_128 [Sinorhizobium phage phiM12]AKF12636.1 hypothetical protein PHIM7_89 [Sinorhizobium phage phiM7]AKZ65596.1 hypothetical protein PHIN3_104 [Sinorhizobium phage phiN3]
MIATEREHLMRDVSSHALINKDVSLFKQRQAMRQRDQKIRKLEDDVQSLAMELREIRESIATIVNRN